MWRYLVLNCLWFALLFFVNFFGSTRSRRFVLFGFFSAAATLAFVRAVDPFVWMYYFAASLLVFWGSYQFKRWAHAPADALDEDLSILTRKFDAETSRLAQKSAETGVIARQADEITHLCEKIKQMSQSLDRLETFLVFGEALAKNFIFDSIKLLFLDDSPRAPRQPEQVFHLFYTDFQASYDRSSYLRDASRVKGELFEFDKNILAALIERGKPLNAVGATGREAFKAASSFVAYPVLLNGQVFAALFIMGVNEKDAPIVSILAESFIAEMQRVKLYERVETLAVTDGLTGVSVRRHLIERLEEELDRSRRLGLKLSFLMIDIDDFKRFNDRYGHLVGDVVLKEAAQTIRKNIREVDLVGRYGGEEFGVFLIETDESGAFFVAERIRHAIADRSYKAYDESLRLTVSIGCSTCVGGATDAAELIENADAALYEAKRHGKNRVRTAGINQRNEKGDT